MRLVCPNCGAQYEVASDAIPEAGRDVQCSNCGHAWFTRPYEDEDDEAGLAPPPQPVEATEPQRPAPARRELDPEVANVLREEAEREARARQAEADATFQDQPELGLTEAAHEPDRRETETRQRMEKLRGLDTEALATPVGTTAASAASRRDLLPDIDEINSTLEGSHRDEPEEEIDLDAARAERGQKRKGFRLGFSLTLLVAVVLVLAYLYAPQIKAAAPQFAGLVDSYVSEVNGYRGWLQDKITELASSQGDG